MTSADIVQLAKRQLEAITGVTADTVSRFDRSPEGWALHIDMVEHRAIPRTHDLIARYEVALDEAGNLLRWRRTMRSQRGQIMEEA